MFLTIKTLFNDAGIVSAIINRVNQTRKDTIYWKQYLDFKETKSRVFKDYIGTITGVMAGSINSQFGEKPIRERRNIGTGYGEVAYLGDRYQMSKDRLSELQDLIDKYNAAKTTDQIAALNEIVDFLYDDFHEISLAAHKRMDIVVASLLMTGSAQVTNRDNAKYEDGTAAPKLLDIDLPLNVITPTVADITVDSKVRFICWLQAKLQELAPDYGQYAKMIMSRKTFVKNIIGSSEFGDKFKMQLDQNQMYVSTGLVTSALASQMFTGIGLPAIEIKEDYVKEQNGKNFQIYADNRITLLPQDKIGYMRHHTPYEATDPEDGRTYVPAGDKNTSGQMLISNQRDHQGRYMEYTAEWIPQISNPQLITNINLETLNA
jgi:hypothetical protein